MGGEVPLFLLGESGNCSPVGNDSESHGCRTETSIGDKIFAVGRFEDISNSTISVKVFDKLTGKWQAPVVLGRKPVPRKGHSAVPLDDDRLLILLRDSSLDNGIWFLEVDTPFVKQKKKMLGTEVVAWSRGLVGHELMPIVISGPSGVGKGTLIAKLMKEFPSTFAFSVSHTTRAPRGKELNGVHYHFTERNKMEKDIEDGKFLESALVHGNLYGTSIEVVEAVSDAGKRCILDIDVQGARSVRASSLEAIFIFVCPPSFEELEMRLRARYLGELRLLPAFSTMQLATFFSFLPYRAVCLPANSSGTETEEQIQRRLRNARAELEQGKSPGLFDHILVNDEFESCYQNLKKILALDENINAPSQTFTKNFKVPVSYSISKLDGKVIIQYESNELGASSSMFILDVSSLQGGSPSITRGLNMYSSNS